MAACIVGASTMGTSRAAPKHDACYHKVKAQYSGSTWPSARASQAIAKCRKKSGHVRKTAAGSNLKRWTKEKWKDTKTGKPCGHKGGGTEYCRPSHKVSSKTPKMPRGKHLKDLQKSKTQNGRASRA